MIHYIYQYENDGAFDHKLKIVSSDHKEVLGGLSLDQATKICSILNSTAIKMEELSVNSNRYEKIRKFNPVVFTDVYRHNISSGIPFDKLIDEYKI